jgi:hypothetical protein
MLIYHEYPTRLQLVAGIGIFLIMVLHEAAYWEADALTVAEGEGKANILSHNPRDDSATESNYNPRSPWIVADT